MTSSGKLVYEETAEDHDAYFASGGWEAAGGCLQSLAFAMAALGHLRERLAPLAEWSLEGSSLRFHGVDIHDYGCALGDGTAALAAAFPLARVRGFDFSEAAVEEARRRWKTLQFDVSDINAPREDAYLIWTSHVLEHQRDAAETVRGLLRRCVWLVAIVPRFDEGDSLGGHDGAEPTKAWMSRLPPPQDVFFYVLPRKVPKTHQAEAGEVLFESNVLVLWKGDLSDDA